MCTTLKNLPTENRAICPDCFGKKSYAGCDLDVCDNPNCDYHRGCLLCHHQPGPCDLHQCRTCNGTGMVCPICRGDRSVRLAGWDSRNPWLEPVRCDACCEGNQVSTVKEKRAIDAYVRRHQIRQLNVVNPEVVK